MVFSSKSALDEEIPKEIREVKVDSVNQNALASSSSKIRDGEGSEMERGGSSEDTDDEDEEGQRDRNKAVEWTDDDEKNVMDLGLSEIERNRRLESLIARRRSRRWLSAQARKNLAKVIGADPAAQVAAILVPRNNPFLANSSDSQTSPTPGSAPSVLLPMRNPFDLPYDPQEEKPNLRGDEFHQEFMAAHQKDIMFCRHESFVRGPFDRPDNSRGRNALDRIHTKPTLHEDFADGSSPSKGKTFKAKRESILKSPKLTAWKRMAAERRDNGRMNEFLFDSGPSVFGRITMRERCYHPENGPQHTPTNSFASDMQVEVSESSSPPLTVDGDEESSSLNERDMEKRFGSGNEEMWGASSHLSDVDKNESSSREIHEVSESDIMQVGFSRISHKSEPVSSLHLSPVKEVEQEPVDSNPFSHLKIELTEKSVAPLVDSGNSEETEIKDKEGEQRNGETSSSTLGKEIKVGALQASGIVQNYSPGELPSDKITPAVPHNTPVLARGSTDRSSNDTDFENVKEFSNPLEKENKETNSAYSGNESEIPKNTDIQITNKKMDGKDEIEIKQESEREQSKPSQGNDSKSTDDIAGQLDKPTEEIRDNSTQVERKEIPESSENRGEERGIEEGESSVNNQGRNESIEQTSITTSSVLSPKSVLNPKLSISSLSSLGQDYMDEQQPHSDVVENNPMVEISRENLAPVAPQNENLQEANSVAKHEEKGEEKLKKIEGDSQISSNLESTEEVSKPYDEQESNSIKEIECMLDKISSAAGSKPAEPSENSVTASAKEDSAVSSKPAESSENSVTLLAKEDSASSSKQAEPSENSVALLVKKEETPSNPPQRSVEGEINTNSNANESSVADNTESKDSSSQSMQESGDRNRTQANLTRQWWLTID